MSEAFEVSPDDPDGVAAAIERASQGSRVRVVRQGHAVADIVPIGADGSHMEGRDHRHDQRVRDHAARFGAPTLEHYRRVYATAGRTWPGEAHIRALYPVADVS